MGLVMSVHMLKKGKYVGGMEINMRINDFVNNIQNNSSTGINNDLSLVDGVYPDKNKAAAPGEKTTGAVGFFNALENSKKVKGSATYSLNEAKGIETQGFAEKILGNLEGSKENDKELVKNLTGDDYKALEDERMSLEKFSKERLEKAIERIKENRELKEVRLTESVQKQQEYAETVERMAAYSQLDTGSEKLIAKMLYEADIPVTEENIDEIKQAFSISNTELTDSAESYLIKNNLAPTIDNIYKAGHSGEMRLAKLDEASWDSLKEKALEIVNEAGEDTGKGLANARWLVEHDIPVTAENILYKSELDGLKEKNGLDEEFVYNASIRAMQKGGNAGDGVLSVRLQEAENTIDKELTALIDNIPTIENAAIRLAFADGANEDTVTISELVKAEEKIQGEGGYRNIAGGTHGTEAAVGNASIARAGMVGAGALSEPVGMSDREVNTRIRLEEVRVSLTIEAGRRLMSNGIDIFNDSLMKVTEGIRELQKDIFRDLYNEIALDDEGLEISSNGERTGSVDIYGIDDASELALRTKESLNNLSNAPLDFYKATFSVRHTVTLAEISETGEVLIKNSVKEASGSISVNPASMQSALAYYEESSTEVRRDLGDSIKKAFSGSVDSLLTENGLELTEGNRRAVRILGYNSMEITKESIENMKYYDAKVTGLVEKMSGSVVMTMIRSGINPLDLNIDELSEKVDSIIKEQGDRLEQKYSEFLENMERAGAITENERNAYIGIYRLLYNIEKNDGSAVGSLLGSGRELTMRNLMTEARSMNQSLDMVADDDTDIKSSHYTNSVTGQIDAAFNYQMSLVEKCLSVTSADIWDRALSGKDYGAMTIEGLNDGLSAAQNIADSNAVESLSDSANSVKAAEIVRTMTSNTPASVMLNSFGIKDSFENRKAAEDMIGNPGAQDSAINVSAEELSTAFDSPSRFDELLGIKTRMANSLIGQAFKTAITAQSAAELNARVERIEMLQKLAGKDHFRLTIDDGDESPKQVNLTLIRNSENAGTVSIQISKEGYELQADLSMVIMDARYDAPSVTKGNISVKGVASGETEEKTAKLKELLKDSGINADNINISGATRTNEAYISYISRLKDTEKKEETHTEEGRGALLSVAKAFLSAF
ncbi:MAG: hypothetical protein IKW90_12070 [Lachnospiraceae bacterium]|nr:hypothetical protein [Lachnospiraceae bacterium]